MGETCTPMSKLKKTKCLIFQSEADFEKPCRASTSTPLHFPRFHAEFRAKLNKRSGGEGMTGVVTCKFILHRYCFIYTYSLI